MEVQRSYVVRIYRHDDEAMTGTLEAVESGEVVPFRCAAELWSALQQSSSQRRFPSTAREDDR
ncbi:MAG: hypothetical protein IT532_09020 [Burkholderiales bacterium]|nr:hypothetical protein [Burkholderiales bacterium]